ncbi:hypothetical protein [Pseudobdellovibrio exovorus]|uniref:Uncharacterized protein n=1 Tax=Pseudobdellovibrio exovorus JSS TaxID=1184267 RepID=M4VNK3_9BACT|nr:hypothetical protein [Pseudobdellovibrio exovorus]AGH94684.1 hypothetical protein A11Q_464 [Pseudobdellovibrio exovorus JSS]
MSQNSNFLKNTLDLLETDPEVKAYIYQQILEFNPFVTPETVVMVVARDPQVSYLSERTGETEEVEEYADLEASSIAESYRYRLAIVLKDGESSIEAEAFHNDIFEAVRMAKEGLIEKLIEIQEEIENPVDRINAIKEASDNTQIH